MRYLLVGILFLLPFGWTSAHNSVDSAFVADYDEILQLLKECDANLERYNAVNDSIFLPVSKSEWVSTFIRRARVSSETYDRSRNLLSRITQLSELHQTWAEIDSLSHLPLHVNDKESDPFVYGPWYARLASFYDPEKLTDTKHLSNYLRCLLHQAEADDAYFRSGDTIQLKNSIELNQQILRLIGAPNVSWKGTDLPTIYASVYSNLAQNFYALRCGFMTVDQQIAVTKLYNEQLPSIISNSLLDEATLYRHKQELQSFDSYLLRNVYLADTTHRFDKQRDSLQALEIEKYADPLLLSMLPAVSQARIHIARYRAGVQTARQSLNSLIALREQIYPEVVTNANIMPVLTNILNCAYLVDESDLSEKEKHAYIIHCCEDIYRVLRQKQAWISSQSINNTLLSLALYPRIHRHLDTQESKHFLLALLFYTQPFTCAHTETVAHLAVTLLRGVIEYQPELLLNVPGCTTVDEVRTQKEELASYLRNAILFHDLGKSRYPSIVHDEHRPLTDYEYNLLRQHPQFGLEYLKIKPSFMQYHDLVLGHHKWYDGKGGYPASFDNTQSPVRVLIDILTIADCMEAATSRLGRNYRKGKNYDDIINEFQAEAGTRYNPYLIDLMINNKDVGNAMRYIIETGWEEIYYQTFSLHQQVQY